jgi:hypothetical protein
LLVDLVQAEFGDDWLKFGLTLCLLVLLVWYEPGDVVLGDVRPGSRPGAPDGRARPRSCGAAAGDGVVNIGDGSGLTFTRGQGRDAAHAFSYVRFADG